MGGQFRVVEANTLGVRFFEDSVCAIESGTCRRELGAMSRLISPASETRQIYRASGQPPASITMALQAE